MKDLVSWFTAHLSGRIIIDGLAIVSGVTGIVGFVRDSFGASQNLPWILIVIALSVGVYRLWVEKSKIDILLMLRPGSGINIEQAVAMLGNSTFDYRVEAISDLVDRLPGNLSGSDASALLGNLSFDYRVEGIRILAPKIKKRLSNTEAEQILDSLTFDYRTQASHYLLEKKQL